MSLHHNAAEAVSAEQSKSDNQLSSSGFSNSLWCENTLKIYIETSPSILCTIVFLSGLYSNMKL